jgi:NAD(P)-dependent dehydrogenase (short-subunit alcohol dehydrogenase family)
VSIHELSLKGTVAIITGARQGIGKTLALAFAEAGADMVICDKIIEDNQLDLVAAKIRKIGRRCLTFQVDVSQKADIDKMVEAVEQHFKVIDILVNNAGIVIRRPFLEHSEDDWDKVINVDLKGCFLCCQSVGRKMVVRKRGAIINMASMWGIKGTDGRVSYSVAKAGVIMLTRVLARELGSFGIRVNAIAPTSVKTEFSQFRWQDPEELKRWEADIPLGRIAVPDDIIGTALFLASNASAYISGHTIVVDGGRFA